MFSCGLIDVMKGMNMGLFLVGFQFQLLVESVVASQSVKDAGSNLVKQGCLDFGCRS